MQTEKVEFVICVSNEGHEDLEVWKLFRVPKDQKADEVGCLRVFDESGEDYLYPQDRFVKVDFPGKVRERLLAIATL